MRGDTILKRQQVPQPLQASLPELLDSNKGVGPTDCGPTDCGTDHQHDNLFKRVDLSVTRIFQRLETFEERQRAGRLGTCMHRLKRSESRTVSFNNLNAS